MQWYYLDEQRQQTETTEEELRRLAASGDLKPGTPVWNESMTEWEPLSRALSAHPLSRAHVDETGTQIHPYQPPLGSSRSSGNIRALAAILARHAGWTRFLGVLTVTGGIFTIPAGIFFIWTGILLFQIAAQAEEAKQSGSERTFGEALEKTALYFKANAVFLLVALILGVALAAAAIALGIYAATQGKWPYWAP